MYPVQTAVVDSAEGSPAYQDVCRFFEQELRLTVPREMREVPVLLVVSVLLSDIACSLLQYVEVSA